ncbi:MAG: 4Fe-4S dicluster domain-containing protein [Hyphomicrobiales bacterium]|nr:4Fe-4S dicluster domain-containing protein [Hyphomicrobiales bacterium]
MTSLPKRSKNAKKLGLVIDLDTCVGCHACVVSCKEWNTGGYPAPLSDAQPYGREPSGAFLNRVHSYETANETSQRTVYFPKSCLHCENAQCVTVCPTGASYKRAEDGIVLVDEDLCIGCGLCAWACPYGAREMDPVVGVMKKCTLCIDRIYNENIPPAERRPACVNACPAGARHFGDLGDPESSASKLAAQRPAQEPLGDLDYRPTNKYLAPRKPKSVTSAKPLEPVNRDGGGGFIGWVDAMLSKLNPPA